MGDVVIRHRPVKETEPVTSTVDHADIRGLGTTLLVSVRCLPRSRHEDLSQPLIITPTRVAPSPGLRLLRGSAVALMPALGYRIARYAATGCSLAIAHMNPMSSRATAAAIVFGCLPRANIFR